MNIAGATSDEVASSRPSSARSINQVDSLHPRKAQGKRTSSHGLRSETSEPTGPANEPTEEADAVVSPKHPAGNHEQTSAPKSRKQLRKVMRKRRKSILAFPKKRRKPEINLEEASVAQERDQKADSSGSEQPESQAAALLPKSRESQKETLASLTEDDYEDDDEQEDEPEVTKGNNVSEAFTRPAKHHGRLSRPRGVVTQIPKSRSRISKKKSNIRRRESAGSNAIVPGEPQSPDATKRGEDSVPITVYRLSRPHALQLGPQYQDILYGPPPFPKRNGVNAVDVLGQVCREIVQGAIEKLSRAAEIGRTGLKKAEWKTRRKAAEMFGTELESRLFELVSCASVFYLLCNRVVDLDLVRSTRQ